MTTFFFDYELLAKSGLFDASFYRASNPDVGNLDPLVHYLEQGAREGRPPRADFDTSYYLEQCRALGDVPDNPLLHFVTVGGRRGLKIRREETDAEDAPRDDTPAPEAAAADAGAGIILTVDAVRLGSGPSGRGRQIRIEGWAIAQAPIVEIVGSVDGAFAGHAIYGQRRTDVGRIYPHYPKSDHAGFSILLDPGSEDGRESIDVALVARTEDGASREITVPIGGLLHGGAEPVAADDVDLSRDTPATPSPPLQLHVDHFGVDAQGVLRIAGWAVCFVQIGRIEVFLDDESLGATDRGSARPDVAKTCPEYPNAAFSGYAFAADVRRFGAGRHVLKVEAVSETGITREIKAPLVIPDLASPERESAAPAFSFNCDEILLTTAGSLSVNGWAVPASPTESITVLLDGHALGEADVGGERPDVGNHLPTLVHARKSGFAFHGMLDEPIEGEHLVTLVVRGTNGEKREIPLPVLARDFATERVGGLGDVLKISVDSPALIGGAVASPVRGNLEISGWALAKDGVASIEVSVDGQRALTADYGMRRMDVAAAFPDWDSALTSGFFAMLPHRLLSAGRHAVAVTVNDRSGRSEAFEFHLDAEPAPETSGPWSLRRTMPQAEVDLHMQIVARLDPQPRFTLLLEIGDDALDAIIRTLASLRKQTYPEWRLTVTARKPVAQAIRDAIALACPDHTDRIVFADRKSSALADLAARDPRGDRRAFLAVLGAGDELGCDALLEMAVAIALYPDADFFYSDERRGDPATGEVSAFFKPQWSPDLLLSTNYIGRLWCAHIDLLRRADIVTRDLLDRGDYDIVLRCTEQAVAIRHLAKVLAERGADGRDPIVERRALSRALSRRGIEADVLDGCAPGHFRVKRKPAVTGKVSIIIPTCAARGLIKTCLETLREKTAYRNIEIICIENIPEAERHWKTWLREHADIVVEAEPAFNWARFNNRAAAEASGEFLLFLNDDIEIIDGAWLDTLLEHATRPEVGAVGPLLLYPDRKIQHAGMFLARPGQARHAFRYAQEDELGYFGLAQTQRDVVAVTGACLLTRRETFDALGGFEEQHSVINNDLDYCLKVLRGGMLNVFTPHAKLIHHELASRAAIDEAYDTTAFDSQWRDRFLLGDPYFHPRLSADRDDYAIDWEAVETVHAGHPIARRESIRKILAVKLDHIGDCVIALPAVRRLKQHFPDATVHVLSGRSSKSVWSVEPAVDGIIEFDFFHARSSLGPVPVSDDDLARLGERLAAYDFDLAVDLRKSIDTRHVLKCAGARVTAGFDYRDRFPWLDVALEWEGDPTFSPKRQHVADSLINLVDAIAAACETDRTVIRGQPAEPPAAAFDAIGGKRLFSRPVVCIHPAVGTVMRQWPAASFAELANLLIERCGVHAMIIGGPDEMEVAKAVLAHIRHPRQVWNAVGAFPLGALPGVLARAALFVGNNSGPKHIAAGLGVPTIGIHSGVVDAQEWGPLGPRAVAVQRDMSCSPCYLTKMEDCQRGFACMKGITPGEVFRLCERMLATTGASAGRAAPAKAATRSRRTKSVRPEA